MVCYNHFIRGFHGTELSRGKGGFLIGEEVNLSGFYKLTREQRLEKLHQALPHLEETATPELSQDLAEQLIENYIFNYELPLGLAVNIQMNGKRYLVPMVIEEPSVVAAASNGGKRLGNILASTEKRIISGQVIFQSEKNIQEVQKRLTEAKAELLEVAKTASLSMVNRGGGPIDIWCQAFGQDEDRFVTFYLSFQPGDAMGANSINTVLEELKPHLESLMGEEALMCILSNYQEEAVSKAAVQLPIARLHPDGKQALAIAKKIAAASLYASFDVYRATTHNKGIMNGIDALALATGNDWRAIEAGAHAYAARDGHYRNLSQWTYNEEEQLLEGQLEIPLQIGTVGGTLSAHPTAQWALRMLNIQEASELANLLATMGLIQNFSALYALVTEGIQKGHMRMQARSLAIQAGAKLSQVEQVVQELSQLTNMNFEQAKLIVNKISEAIQEEKND